MAACALALSPGLAYAQPAARPAAQKPPPKLAWAAPCSFSMTDGSDPGVKVQEHHCDYMLANQARVQEFFNKSMNLAQQRDYLSKQGRSADQALQQYESQRDALLTSNDPAKVAEPKKGASIISVKTGIEELKRMKVAVDQQGVQISARFGAGKKYLQPFQEHLQKLDSRIAKDELALPEREREEKEKTEKAVKKAFDKSKDKTGSAHTLEKAGSKLQKADAKGGTDVDKEAEVKSVFGEKTYKGDVKTRDKHSVGAFGPGKAHLEGNHAHAKKLGTAADYSPYAKGGSAILDDRPMPPVPGRDSLVKEAPPSPAQAPAAAAPPDPKFFQQHQNRMKAIEQRAEDAGVARLMSAGVQEENAALAWKEGRYRDWAKYKAGQRADEAIALGHAFTDGSAKLARGEPETTTRVAKVAAVGALGIATAGVGTAVVGAGGLGAAATAAGGAKAFAVATTMKVGGAALATQGAITGYGMAADAQSGWQAAGGVAYGGLSVATGGATRLAHAGLHAGKNLWQGALRAAETPMGHQVLHAGAKGATTVGKGIMKWWYGDNAPAGADGN